MDRRVEAKVAGDMYKGRKGRGKGKGKEKEKKRNADRKKNQNPSKKLQKKLAMLSDDKYIWFSSLDDSAVFQILKRICSTCVSFRVLLLLLFAFSRFLQSLVGCRED